jgi:hypothetical protein
MKWCDYVQLRLPLFEDCTLIRDLVNCLKYSKLLSNAVDTFPECGMLEGCTMRAAENIIYENAAWRSEEGG